jgi:hypothetical protein
MIPDDATAELLAFPQRPEDRLRLSLRSLDAALAEQRQAVAGLRAELASLSGAVAGLDGSLRTYHGTLGHAAAALAEAGAKARALETTADAMLAAARG